MSKKLRVWAEVNEIATLLKPARKDREIERVAE